MLGGYWVMLPQASSNPQSLIEPLTVDRVPFHQQKPERKEGQPRMGMIVKMPPSNPQAVDVQMPCQ